MIQFPSSAWIFATDETASVRVGMRIGDKGTHTSRTMMLAEISVLLAHTPTDAKRADYTAAIVDQNVLGKATTSSRRLTSQRLAELYGLDLAIPLFRVFRRLWDVDASSRPLLAMLCCLARDPLLRATAGAVIPLVPAQELQRMTMTAALRAAIGDRLNDAILDKVARNAASSWAQSGHLEGRVRKIRRRVDPTPYVAAFALWLGAPCGVGGRDLLASPWAAVLDRGPTELMDLMQRARQLGLIRARVGGDVFEIDVSPLDAGVRAPSREVEQAPR